MDAGCRPVVDPKVHAGEVSRGLTARSSSGPAMRIAASGSAVSEPTVPAAVEDVVCVRIAAPRGLGLDLADLRHNPKVPTFGRGGSVFVRWGISSQGSAPKRRTVLTVPETDWIVAVLEQWRDDVRPACAGIGDQWDCGCDRTRAARMRRPGVRQSEWARGLREHVVRLALSAS